MVEVGCAGRDVDQPWQQHKFLSVLKISLDSGWDSCPITGKNFNIQCTAFIGGPEEKQQESGRVLRPPKNL